MSLGSEYLHLHLRLHFASASAGYDRKCHATIPCLAGARIWGLEDRDWSSRIRNSKSDLEPGCSDGLYGWLMAMEDGEGDGDGDGDGLVAPYRRTMKCNGSRSRRHRRWVQQGENAPARWKRTPIHVRHAARHVPKVRGSRPVHPGPTGVGLRSTSCLPAAIG